MNIELTKEKKMHGFIYAIKNSVNNKIYIGQTTQKITTRFQQHKYYAGTGRTHLTNAINKYGEDLFSVKLIRECSDQEELNYYEAKYIELYDSIKFGYNLDKVIRGGGSRSEETKMRMRKAQSHRNRPFNVYDLNGKFIGSYRIASDAESELNVGFNQVNLCLNGAMNRSGNYIFIDVDEDTEEKRAIILKTALSTYQNHAPRAIKVFLKKDGSFVGDFENANVFARQYGVDSSCVSKVAAGKLRYVKEYFVIFAEDYTQELLKNRLEKLGLEGLI